MTIPLPGGLPPILLPIAALGGGAPTYPITPPTRNPAPIYPIASHTRNPFRGRAMWIWELPDSSGGDLSLIIAQAKRYGVRTLMIKSSDGTNGWAQYTRPMVSIFRGAGLKVCAWQYIYGQAPADEARLGAGAVRSGASCLVIDAESEYEGRYAAAQRYLTRLRQLIGANFPVGLAGFPYVDYHPAFPYSVFLGPGGAQYSLPQMYWMAIGTTVDNVYAHTYMYNRPYQRPIYPLGQVYQNPPARQVIRFRQLADGYGAQGVSWWDYQEATRSNWRAIGVATARPAGFVPDPQVVILSRGWKGDLVVWAQEHLYSAGYHVRIDGDFGRITQGAVASFQTAHGLAATGAIDSGTWAALLRYKPANVRWAEKSNKHGIARIANVSGTTPPPLSASLPGRDEFHGTPGRGH